MSSTRNVLIALFFTSVSLHAVTLSSKISFSESQLRYAPSGNYYIHLTPPYSANADVLPTPGIKVQTSHHTPLEFLSGSLQLSGMYNSTIGLYGEFGTHYSLQNSHLFASGSLKFKPNSFSPYFGLGAYYAAQNSSQIELGASIGCMGYEISNTNKGTLFNGYTELSASGITSFPVNINVNITYPFTDNLHTYCGLSYGLAIFDSKLPQTKGINIEYISALLAEPSETQAAYIGDYIGATNELAINKLSLGLKLNIKDF